MNGVKNMKFEKSEGTKMKHVIIISIGFIIILSNIAIVQASDCALLISQTDDIGAFYMVGQGSDIDCIAQEIDLLDGQIRISQLQLMLYDNYEAGGYCMVGLSLFKNTNHV